MNFWLQDSNQLDRRVLAECDGAIHRAEGFQDGESVSQGIEGAIIALSESPYRGICVNPDEKTVTECSSFGEVADVSRMQDVEDAICEDQSFSLSKSQGLFDLHAQSVQEREPEADRPG